MGGPVNLKFTLRFAQIVFLVILPKELIYAANNEDFVYDGRTFTSSERCEAISKNIFPFFIVGQNLFNKQTKIPQGALVSLTGATNIYDTERTFRVLKTPASADANLVTTTQKLPLEYAENPTRWYLQITQAKTSPLGDLKNKTLRLYHRENQTYFQRCCSQSQCVDHPIFAVFDKTKLIGTIAFQPGKTDFLTSYKAISNSPQSQLPAKSSVTSPSNGALIPPSTVTPSSAIALAAVTTSPADDTQTQTSAPAPSPATAPEQKVICTQSAPLRIYNDTLNKVIYNAPRFLPVKVYQDWSGGPAEKTVKGHPLVKVQLATGSGKEIIGWAAGTYIKAAKDCKGMPLIFSANGEDDLIPGATVVTESPGACCRFPTMKAPSADYARGAGARWFGANRRGGKRKHAAADLLRPEGEKVFAVDGGKVLRKYYFYSGTYAIEVKHDSGMVARYGEVAKTNVAQSGSGERVLKGQHIGYIGSLDMLHFELYSDRAQGPLTVMNAGQYWRRSDLLDPTPHLKKWQEMTF